jgi:hypothetical protein
MIFRPILITLALLTGLPAAEPKVSFNRDIRPILANRCFQCHGPDEKKRKSELRLDTREGALADLGGYSAIVPGNPNASELLKRIMTKDSEELMPPEKSKKPRLTKSESLLFKQWIDQGAEYQGHWAFEPLNDQQTPPAEHPVDHFIRKRLAEKSISPAPQADPYTLIRRLYLDLIGLLPSPEEITAFLNDQSGHAYENLVDSLLANPHYGERWGRHWLDQARYADSHGYSIDSERQMWPYRDWVINAINKDMPFDLFTIEQIAGDLLPNASKDQIAATAFHRNTLINQEGGSDPEQFRVEATMDRVNTTGSVWLGLTIGCAQCHTHKFDPITHREYYQMFAFFNNVEDRNNTGPTISIGENELIKSPGKNAVDAGPPAKTKPVNLMVMRERKAPRETFLMTRGDFTRPDKEQGKILPGSIAAIAPPLEKAGETGTRLDLARWLVNPANPLTPRVTVNRIWMRYFGRGLVETEEDFGTRGSLPSHPELLDYLASRFISDGWSMKKLHRLIVTSATYRQSSTTRKDLADKDPRNFLLARQSRIRLDAEIIRDAALSASGLLEPRIGGRGIRPPQPAGIYAFTQNRKGWSTSKGSERYRRAMYIVFFRSSPYPLFGTFDAPDFQTACTSRTRSNTPLQALAIANDVAFMELARGLARRVIHEVPGDATAKREARIRRIFLLALGRPPGKEELKILLKYSQSMVKDLDKDSAAAKSLLQDPLQATATISLPEAASLVALSRAIFNTDNFITRE